MAKKLWITSLSDPVVTRGDVLTDPARTVVDKGSKFRVYNIRGIAWRDQVVVEIESDNVRGIVPIDQVISRNQAIDYFTDQLRSSPASSMIYAIRGNIWYTLGEYDIAIADYTAAIQIDSKNEVVFNNRGYCRWKKGDYSNALADYNESIRLGPNYAPALNNRSLLWATCPDPKYRDVFRAVKTAHVWVSTNDVDFEVIDPLAAASLASKDSSKILAWIGGTKDGDAKTYFLAQWAIYREMIWKMMSILLVWP
jgi:tetratricopeptide (TPR) repeat protein